MALTPDQFGKSVVKAGLASADDLKTIWKSLPGDDRPKDGEAFSKLLVEHQQLTSYQSQQILTGSGDSLVLGDYVILDRIGAGGMGQVFKARHRRMKRIVALKLLPTAVSQEPASIKRFEREVEAAARLTHPNVVIAYDAGRANGQHFLVMEYVDGSDLASHVKKNGRMAVSQALDCVLQAARGLEYAHEQGVVHRDIKPPNLLLDKKGVVKILDMGLARFDSATPEHTELTVTNQIMGTVDYMAPEQALNTKCADARADIYSLGVTLWYLLTAQSLYEGDTLMAKLIAHRERPLPSLREARPDVPAKMEAVFRRMVAKSVKERYQTMAEVIGALRHLECGDSSSLSNFEPRPVIHTSPRHKNTKAATSHRTPKEAPHDPAATIAIDQQTTDTDPQTQQSLAVPVIATAKHKQPSKSRPDPIRMFRDRRFLAVALLGLVVICFGVWVIVRDKDGKEVARIRLPDGGSVAQEKLPEDSKVSSPAKVAAPAMAGSNDRAVAEWVLSVGGSLAIYDPQNPKPPLVNPVTKRDQLPAEPFELLCVDLSRNTRVSDADLARFTGLKQLRTIDLSHSPITNAGIETLGDLPALKSIVLGRTKVDSAGVRALERFGDINTVNAQESPLTDDGAAYLSEHFPKLGGLFVAGSNITDAGLRTLLQKPQFRAGSFSGITDLGVEPLRGRDMLGLQLYESRVTRRGVEAIATCSNLIELHLYDNPSIDDACVAEIAKLSKLTSLRLYRTAVTDACVDDLLKLTNLKELILPKATITPAALARLRAALPDCDVKAG